jgi:tetratricopeptide (TPR) repeat protein
MRNKILIPLLGLGAVAAGIYLAPNTREMALMQMNDAHFKEAMGHYENLQSQGDNSINVTVPLIKLYVNSGDIDKAIELLETFIKDNPNSFEAYKQLAELYKSSQRFHSYCRTLEIMQRYAPSASNLRELADTYDFLGRYEDEMQALSRMVASEGYKPQENDYIKLASFYRVGHQYGRASEAAVSFIKLKGYDVSMNIMELAVQLLLEAGQEQEAIIIASKYVDKKDDAEDATELSIMLQKKGDIEAAYNLLAPFLPGMEGNIGLEEQVISLQLARGKYKEVYEMLSGQFEKKTMPDNFSVTLVELAIRFKNYDFAQEVIRNAAIGNMEGSDLLRYAGLSLQLKRPELAQYMKNNIDKEYLRETPLLSALLEAAIRDTAESTAALLALPPDTAIPAEYKMPIADIYLRHGYTRQALALFDGMTAPAMLNIMDAQQFARLYIDVGQPGKAEKLLADAGEKNPPSIQDSIEKAGLFLDAGTGKTGEARKWLDKHPDAGIQLLGDAYALSEQYKNNDAALLLAKELYRASPTRKNQMQLAEALMLNRQYAEALEHLKLLADNNADARDMYLDAMESWIHNAGIKKIPYSHREDLEKFIKQALDNKYMPLEKKRSLAYLLKDAGFYEQAEGIFLEAAGEQPFVSKDVSELLGFWGDNLSPVALSWVDSRARNTSGSDKAQWLAYLNDTEHPQRVILIVTSINDYIHVLPQPVIDEYINALRATHNTVKLGDELAKEIDKVSDVVRLKKLADIARQEDIAGIAEKGWRKIYGIAPGDAQAQKELGLLAFSANHYTEAEKFLTQYLGQNKGDYKVNYIYAELLQRQAKKDQAKAYFEQAQKQISEIKNKNMEDYLEEARLFYRTNRPGESIALYRKLLAQYPGNKELRADFAEVLIDNRQFEEASRVLGE